MPLPLLVTFAAGSVGSWNIDGIAALRGAPLALADRLAVHDGVAPGEASAWMLRGSTGHARYSTRAELDLLTARQQGLGRSTATCAALIPIKKSEAWWALAQDERRDIMEERSRHIAIGSEYLPAVARRLHHSRELGEPFDFLTWFEFGPEAARDFDDMLARLRVTDEWRFVEREIEVRVSLAPPKDR